MAPFLHIVRQRLPVDHYTEPPAAYTVHAPSPRN